MKTIYGSRVMNMILRAQAGDVLYQGVRCPWSWLLLEAWTMLTVHKSVLQGSRLLASPHMAQRMNMLCVPAQGPILLSSHTSGPLNIILALPLTGIWVMHRCGFEGETA